MNTNPAEQPAWRVTAFVCECERIGVHLHPACAVRLVDADDDDIEMVGEDWRALAREAVTQVIKRTQAPVGVRDCCVLACSIDVQALHVLGERARQNDAAGIEFMAIQRTDSEMAEELTRILYAAANDIEREEAGL